MLIRVIDPTLNPEDINSRVETWECDGCLEAGCKQRVMSIYDIDYLPKVKAELAVRSRWMPFGNNGSEYTDRWQCEHCRRTCRAETWGRRCEYERCPHCGAFMTEE